MKKIKNLSISNAIAIAISKPMLRLSGLLPLVMTALTLSACGSKNSTFSLLADQNSFKQNASVINGKIDILFVVDNSGSMANSQTNLANNLASFISEFDRKGYDYRIAVVTTDAYRVLFGAPATRAKFKDGTAQTSYTGVFVIEPTTPNLQNTFMTNITQGIYGSGDERALQSMKTALQSPENAPFGFPRADAFLSVIIVSDEEDFSHDNSTMNESYTNPGLHPVQTYVDFLDQLRGASPSDRSMKYNVNTISVLDSACKAQLDTSFPRKIGLRYIEIADATKGIKGSLCDNFGTTLATISNKIIQLTTQFKINGEPNPDTIVVTVGGVNVPRIYPDTPAPQNGFMYNAESNSISFYGSYVPDSGSTIKVVFDPLGLQ